ncbi:hypothetical protein M407DRAFT_5909 [Tulasnella calospora MUT 4182]|uniref:Uncharacterized protein n=1 Tax=Tulasnella calospora MUT 4182 TaxID=1051891 RepID=A0A0C3L7V1_9AGAM|nr:hypothetical protein M407DRAFT_5909 [Tulasnella calospora MUT 4182]
MASQMVPDNVSPFGVTPFKHEDQPLPPLRFQPRMLIAFTVSVEAIRQEFANWPEFVAKVELMKFKRYYAYVYFSTIYDPLDVWDGPDRPAGIPPERLRVALIGPDRPRLAYFNKAADSLPPDERRDMCHLIGFASDKETSAMIEQNQHREPLRVQGPQFNRCKFNSAYIYTSKKLEIIGSRLNPSSRGPEQRWMIMDEDENERLGESFIEDQGRVEHLQKEYHQQHLDEPQVWYTLEDGKLLLDGIDIDLGLARYSVPVDAFLDLDDQDVLEDPCDFEAEVSAIRRQVGLSDRPSSSCTLANDCHGPGVIVKQGTL